MNKKTTFGKLLAIAGIALLAACSSSQPTVDKTIMLAYCKEPSQANMENLSKNYSSIINKSRKTGLKQPGIYCDYAITLVKQGRRAEANSWFNREINDFASSRTYVMQLKRMLIPEYINDNSINTETEQTADEQQALSPASRKAAEDRAASVMDEKKTDDKKNK